MDDQPRITPATSAMHLGIAKKAFSCAANNKERKEIAEKHITRMMEKDIAKLREEFKRYIPTKGA